MDKSESIFVKCGCCCNLIEFRAEYYEDIVDGPMQFEVAVWENRNNTPKLSKKERIRWCDHVMKTGMPWADHTIVTKEEAQRIVEFLTKHIIQNGKTKKDRK